MGADFCWTFITGRIIRGEYGPTAVESHVGWILSGPSCLLNLQTHVLKVSESSLTDDSIKETLTFWSLESMGIDPNDKNSVHESF